MRKFTVATLAFLLTACVTNVEDPSPSTDQAVAAWAKCNYDTSIRLARGYGDPFSLAIAAEKSCIREKNQLLNELIADRRYEQRSRERSNRIMERLEQSMIENNLALIASVRN